MSYQASRAPVRHRTTTMLFYRLFPLSWWWLDERTTNILEMNYIDIPYDGRRTVQPQWFAFTLSLLPFEAPTVGSYRYAKSSDWRNSFILERITSDFWRDKELLSYRLAPHDDDSFSPSLSSCCCIHHGRGGDDCASYLPVMEKGHATTRKVHQKDR